VNDDKAATALANLFDTAFQGFAPLGAPNETSDDDH